MSKIRTAVLAATVAASLLGGSVAPAFAADPIPSPPSSAATAADPWDAAREVITGENVGVFGSSLIRASDVPGAQTTVGIAFSMIPDGYPGTVIDWTQQATMDDRTTKLLVAPREVDTWAFVNYNGDTPVIVETGDRIWMYDPITGLRTTATVLQITPTTLALELDDKENFQFAAFAGGPQWQEADALPPTDYPAFPAAPAAPESPQDPAPAPEEPPATPELPESPQDPAPTPVEPETPAAPESPQDPAPAPEEAPVTPELPESPESPQEPTEPALPDAPEDVDPPVEVEPPTTTPDVPEVEPPVEVEPPSEDVEPPADLPATPPVDAVPTPTEIPTIPSLETPGLPDDPETPRDQEIAPVPPSTEIMVDPVISEDEIEILPDPTSDPSELVAPTSATTALADTGAAPTSLLIAGLLTVLGLLGIRRGRTL